MEKGQAPAGGRARLGGARRRTEPRARTSLATRTPFASLEISVEGVPVMYEGKAEAVEAALRTREREACSISKTSKTTLPKKTFVLFLLCASGGALSAAARTRGTMSVLNFVLLDKNCRVFNQAVGCLAKIGTEISMEWKDQDLTLRALTDTASAYAAVVFQPAFFDSLSKPSELVGGGGGGGEGGAPPQPQLCTKFNSRVLAWACKSTRNIARMHAYFAQQDARNLFVLRVELRSGLVRTHSLHYEDAAILQPTFDKDASPFQLCTAPRMLRTVLDRMHGTEEMSLLAGPAAVQFQSYHDAGGTLEVATLKGPLHTALAFELAQFEGAHLDHASAGGGIARPAGPGEPFPLTAVTCGTRELRHLLHFCEAPAVGADELAFYFSTPGNAILFSTQGIRSRPFRVDLILATVEGPVVVPAPSSAMALLLAEALAAAAGGGGGGGGGGEGEEGGGGGGGGGEGQGEEQQQEPAGEGGEGAQEHEQEQEREQQEQAPQQQHEEGEGGEAQAEAEAAAGKFLHLDGAGEGMLGEAEEEPQQQPAQGGGGGGSARRPGAPSLDPAGAIKRRLAAAAREGKA